MLIEFKVANFRSFREEQTLSMVAGSDKTHPDNLIDCDKFKLLKTAAVYGANASGKSNLVAAIGLMGQFIRASATKVNLGDAIEGMFPFRLDNEHVAQPSRFELTALVNATTYVYGFSATAKRVHDEWLKVRRPESRSRFVSWIERHFDAATGKTDWEIRGPLKKDADLLREKTRDNGLALSRGAELNLAPLSKLFLWFRKRVWDIDLSGSPLPLMQETARRTRENGDFRTKVLNVLRDADVGIQGFEVSERPVPAIPDGEPKAIADVFSTLEKLSKPLYVTVVHYLPDSDKSVAFDLETDESNGTQRLFALAGPILNVLDRGGLLVLDELDCSMHPALVRKLIELFQSPEANPSGAQMVFATHDSTLMDSALFRRDQIWLTEKNASGATELFSLCDIEGRPRKGEALAKNYLAGRYGGVPSFGPTFEDYEIK